MKRFFSLLALLVMIVTTGGYVHAGDVYTLSYDTKIEQSTPGFFTINGSANTRYGGATYNGKTYATGLKFDSKASIKFTSIAKSTLTIVQSLAPTDERYDNDFKLDGKNLGKDNRVDDAQNKIGIYTISGLEAGTHTITKGTGEAGIIFVKVEYEETKTIESTDIELTGVKINGNDLLASDFSNLKANKSLTLTDTYTTTPNVVFVQTTTYTYTDGTNSNKVDNITANVIKSEDNFIATATINGIQYTITLPINKDVTVEAPTHVAVNGTVALSCATEGASISYKIGDGEYKEYTRPFTILDEDATVTAKATLGEKETTCEPFTVEAVKCKKDKTVLIYWDQERFDGSHELIGKTGTDVEGFSLLLNKDDKNYQIAAKIDVNGTSYPTIKLSNGQRNVLTIPEKYKAVRMTLYSFINDKTSTTQVGWADVNGSQEYKSILMGAFNDVADYQTNPDVRVYGFSEGVNSIEFKNTGKQLGFVIALDLVNVATTTAIAIGTAKMATYSNSSAWEVPEGMEVYTATYAEGKVKLNKVTETVIPANTGVVLYGEPKTYTANLATSAADLTEENNLEGTTEDVVMNNETTYVLVKGSDGKVCFGRLKSGETVKAGKAYLTISDPSAAKQLSIDLGGETTGINAVENATEAQNDVYYTLGGQRTVKPLKGLYIHNGKKYMK